MIMTLIVFLYLLAGAVSLTLYFRYFGVYLYDYEEDENIELVLSRSVLVYLLWPVAWFAVWVANFHYRDVSMNIFAKLRKCDRCYHEFTHRMGKIQEAKAIVEAVDMFVRRRNQL